MCIYFLAPRHIMCKKRLEQCLVHGIYSMLVTVIIIRNNQDNS